MDISSYGFRNTLEIKPGTTLGVHDGFALVALMIECASIPIRIERVRVAGEIAALAGDKIETSLLWATAASWMVGDPSITKPQDEVKVCYSRGDAELNEGDRRIVDEQIVEVWARERQRRQALGSMKRPEIERALLKVGAKIGARTGKHFLVHYGDSGKRRRATLPGHLREFGPIYILRMLHQLGISLDEFLLNAY